VEIATSVGFLAPSEMNSYGILQNLDLWLLPDLNRYSLHQPANLFTES
jgi:hypothetical protein